MTTALNWRSVTPSNSPKFMVKGVEISTAICGTLSRFQICEIRSYDADRNADRRYAVRDAHGVSDAEVAAGTRPPIVAAFDGFDDAIAFVNGA